MTECGGIHSSRPEDVLPGINLDNSVYKKNSCQVFFFFVPPGFIFGSAFTFHVLEEAFYPVRIN